MLLKSLDIQGFKSFADKVHFDFSSDITAVVGPNGSGKSNVVDAIRWVLGEQSVKSLRGSKMEDVIFSGSVDRKPVGMARVTMILDNSQGYFPSDSAEIEVTRTLHRSGESGFMLNRHSCRLKDIHEIFMDTGLGRDGFSVIGQGKIEEILTLHAEERRGLIEEAAGISKYKYRKREAERKLEATNDDLTRLDDILFELEERLEPLSRQAEKVRAYHQLKDEEEKLQLTVLSHRFQQEDEAFKKINNEFQTVNEEAVSTQVALDHSEAHLVEQKNELDAKREEMESAQSAFMEMLRQTENDEKNVRLLEERLKYTAERLVSAQQEKIDYSTQLEQEKSAYQQTNASLDEYSKQLVDINNVVQHANNALIKVEEQNDALNQKLSDLQNQQFVTFSKRADINNERTRLEQEISSDSARRDRMKNRLEDLEKSRAEAEKAYESYVAEKQKIDEETALISKAFVEESDKAGAMEEAIRKMNYEQQQLTQRIAKQQSRLDTLKEFEASGEGYYQGVQAVLRAKKNGTLKGICGSVLQLLDIPEQYMLAIENALGGSAQNVVVENDSDAQQAIGWLKQGKMGRATFMPLNLVRGQRQQIEFGDEAVIGLALDLCQYDKRYESVMAQLLGRIWIIRDLKSAVALSKKTGSKHRFVTLEGDVIAPGGSMTGGHSKKQSSIVYRKNEMGKLSTAIQELETQLVQQREGLVEKQNALDVLKQGFAEKQQQIQSHHLRIREIEVLVVQEQDKLQKTMREIQYEQGNFEELSTYKEEAQQKLIQIEQQAQSIQVELAEIEQSLKETNEQTVDVNLERQKAQHRLQEIRITQTAIEEQYQAHKVQAMETTKRFHHLEQVAYEADANAERLGQDKIFIERELDEKKRALQANLMAYHGQEEQISQEKNALNGLENDIRQMEKDTAELRSQNEKLWRQYDSLKQKVDRIEEKIQSIADEIAEVFSLTPQEALDRAEKDANISGMQSRLKTLRQEIARLGEINFTALEEYEQVSQRAIFLREQTEDLHRAKEKLEAVIKDMESTMAKRFKEAYIEVNTRFSRIFSEMFGGGQAHLELSVPNNYLETGIEIIAQPPGKKERVLTLLSGGERALTAMALLFALLEVRPSPFVIFDEIEAALDEANVERFAAFIKQYAERTQFIIISHRKGTIEAANVLYGITMDKNGVSKQVSVRLSDFDESKGE